MEKDKELRFVSVVIGNMKNLTRSRDLAQSSIIVLLRQLFIKEKNPYPIIPAGMPGN